ncbi:ABC transporter substrate-binding protein [Streptomyces sp. NPDC026672]|uniref:ABC transporter substrate-binding protein n=1 Tax=unclassified Streptomyces TaxID=2593676 RepID=UPI003406F7AC
MLRPRNLTALAGTAAIALLMTACGTTGQSSPSGQLDKGDLKGATIAFVPGVNDPFYISMQCGIQAAAAEQGIRVKTQIPQQFEAAVQTPVVNSVVAAHPDALLVAPTDGQALIPPLRRATSAGIPVGLVDTTLQDPSLAFTSIATDNVDAGGQAAETLAKLIGERGSVLVIAFQSGATTSDQRQKGFEKRIADYPGIHYIGAQVNNNDPAKAASIVSAALAAHPNLAGVFATNVSAAQGAATGARNAGAQGKLKIVGFDAGATQVEQLKRGDVQALIAQQPEQIGRLAVKQTIAQLTGEDVDKKIGTDTVVVTRDNLDKPEVKRALYRESC